MHFLLFSSCVSTKGLHVVLKDKSSGSETSASSSRSMKTSASNSRKMTIVKQTKKMMAMKATAMIPTKRMAVVKSTKKITVKEPIKKMVAMKATSTRMRVMKPKKETYATWMKSDAELIAYIHQEAETERAEIKNEGRQKQRHQKRMARLRM